MTVLLGAALAYAKRGWPIFPCSVSKQPKTENGVLDATTNAETIKQWWSRWPRAGIGLDVGGAGMMVLDGDSYKEGFDAAAFDAFPKTALMQRSPRGGIHKFYEIAKGEIVAPDSTGKLGKGIDVRSFNSYVLLAPSSTADGSYEWIKEGKPAFRTDDMVRLTNTHREKSGDRDNWIIEPDLDENIAAAIKWLREDAKIAIQGQGGDHMAYATAAHMKSFGISEALAFDLMWEHWNPRCTPPWNADDVEHLETKVKNGYSYNTSPPGNITPAYKVARGKSLFKPVARDDLESGRECTAGRFRFVDREGMRDIRPPDWLVAGTIPQGAYAILVGAPGSFKSFVAIDLALSVASGVNFPWEGCWPQIQSSGPVLLAVGEGRGNIRNRIEAWEKTHWQGKAIQNVILADPVPLVAEELQPFIDGALALHPEGYKLVVLDTIGRSMQGLDENAQSNASQFTAMVERLQRELGCAVLALHHTGHGSEKRARGSSVFGADADTVLFLDRPNKEYIVELTMLKQKDAEEWPNSKYIRLDEIKLSPAKEHKSLVAMPARQDERPAKASRDLGEDPRVLEIVGRVILEILKRNPLLEMSDASLADAVAVHDDVSIGSSSLRQRYLKIMREDKASPCRHCWNVQKKRWRYQTKE